MKAILTVLILFLFGNIPAFCQSQNLQVKPGKFRLLDKTIIMGETGYLTVPENRLNPNARSIKIKFVRLKSLSQNPKEPVVYLEGGGSASTWQAESPKDLTDWLPILKVSDVIFVDQRGTTDKDLVYIWDGNYPKDFLVSETAAGSHYQKICQEALTNFQKKDIDVSGYNIIEHAKDIMELTRALQIERYSIFGFSFGSHIGMTLTQLFPDQIAHAIFVGADGLDQSFNYPHYLDDQMKKISAMVRQDSSIQSSVPDLHDLSKKVLTRLSTNPVLLEVKHPVTNKSMTVAVGAFGLALILRLDIDDTNDIPAIPRLLYTIDKGDYSMLTWFVQKRLAFAYAVPGNGIHQALASGVSAERLAAIEKQAAESLFGNVVNYPFYDARKVWATQAIKLDTFTTTPVSVRTLFVTGSLDCRTPVQQVEEIIKGYSQATHLVVENAGHEQAMWDTEIFDEAIPQFLMGKDVSGVKAFYKDIKFIPLTGIHSGHPSIK
jgi:pimeloyl-ACP methyl ester carboxylesterase